MLKVNKLTFDMQKTPNYVGGAISRAAPSDDEEDTIPPFELWQHNKSVVRTCHYLIIMPYKRNSDYCRIVKNSTQKTKYQCQTCKLYFYFTEGHNHFNKWHSA